MGIEVQKRAIDIGIIAKDIDAMKTFTVKYRLSSRLRSHARRRNHERFKVGDSIIKVIELDPAAPAEAPLEVFGAPQDIATGHRHPKPGGCFRQNHRRWSQGSGPR